MGLQPNVVNKNAKFVLKTCECCGGTFGPENFTPTHSDFYNGSLSICDNCLDQKLDAADYSWDMMDKFCQYADLPFIPTEWEKIREQNSEHAFHKYAEVFMDGNYDGLDWKTQFERFKRLQREGGLESELPLIADDARKVYRERWGAYSDEGYQYLEHLYKGLMTTQNVNGALQVDQAIKVCKISYEIDKRIEEGTDFDKLLASYDKLVKAADFTPKNVKNINDFDTVGELVRWMEKKHWKNNFYDDVKRDVVDETIANIQNFNRRLYINESGIGDDINHRIELLQVANSLENDNYYGTDLDIDLDKYDNTGYESLFVQEEDFVSDLNGEN